MTDYAIVNLLEIDDSVEGRLPGLEGRFSRKHLDSRDLGISHWRYAPNLRNPGSHSHREQEEAYVVVAGSGRVRLDDEVRDIALWDVIRVAPEVVRAFESRRPRAARDRRTEARGGRRRPVRRALAGRRRRVRAGAVARPRLISAEPAPPRRDPPGIEAARFRRSRRATPHRRRRTRASRGSPVGSPP